MKLHQLRFGAKVMILALVAACVGWMLGLADQTLPLPSTPTPKKEGGLDARTQTPVSPAFAGQSAGSSNSDEDESELKKNGDELPMSPHLRELGKRMAKGILKPSFLNAIQKQALADLNPKYLPFLTSLGLTEEESVRVLDLIHKRNLEVIKARAEFRSQGSNSRTAFRKNQDDQAKIRSLYDEQIASLLGDPSRYEQFQDFEAGRQYDETVRLFEQQNGVQFSPEIQTRLAGALLAARQASYDIPSSAPATAVDEAASRIIQQQLEGVLSPDLISKFSALTKQPQVRQPVEPGAK